mgnify:CR=1 FL=1
MVQDLKKYINELKDERDEAREDYQRVLGNWKEQYAESMRLKKALYDVTTLIAQKATVDGLSLDACNEITEFINAQQKGAESNDDPSK